MKTIFLILGSLILLGAGCTRNILNSSKQKNQNNNSSSSTQQVIQMQQKQIEELSQKIEKLASSTQNQKTFEIKKQPIKTIEKIIEKPIYINTPTTSKDKIEQITITAADIQSYLTGVGIIKCFENAQPVNSGSGSLWNIPNIGYIVLTNEHVISTIQWGETNYCTFEIPEYTIFIKELNQDVGTFWWFDEKILRWNNLTDVAALKIKYEFQLASLPDKLNYSISSLPYCPKRMDLNSPIVIIGFPSSTMKKDEAGTGIWIARTITNGVISAYDDSIMEEKKLPSPDYFISAKIDSGNSGGIALAKDFNGLCVLGIPTWVNIGNFETQGLIQNIHNIFYLK